MEFALLSVLWKLCSVNRLAIVSWSSGLPIQGIKRGFPHITFATRVPISVDCSLVGKCRFDFRDLKFVGYRYAKQPAISVQTAVRQLQERTNRYRLVSSKRSANRYRFVSSGGGANRYRFRQFREKREPVSVRRYGKDEAFLVRLFKGNREPISVRCSRDLALPTTSDCAAAHHDAYRQI